MLNNITCALLVQSALCARYRRCWQMLLPPHSLHTLRTRPCWQMLLPPHSLHALRRRPCWQMLLPPQSLHALRRRPCSQLFAQAFIFVVVSCNRSVAWPSVSFFSRFPGHASGTTLSWLHVYGTVHARQLRPAAARQRSHGEIGHSGPNKVHALQQRRCPSQSVHSCLDKQYSTACILIRPPVACFTSSLAGD